MARPAALIGDLVSEVLSGRGRVCFTVTSSSMEPFIRVEDRVDVRRLGRRRPALGEVVLLRDPSLGHVVHRIIWRWPLWGVPRRIYTKGDAVPYRDPSVPLERILGRVVQVLRGERALGEGRLSRWARLFRSTAALVERRLRPARSAGVKR